MIKSGKEPLIDLDILQAVAPRIRVVAHPIRLRILDYLHHEGEARNVSQIVDICGVEQAVVSQHLKILRESGFVTSRRVSSYIFYELADSSVLYLLSCIRQH